jgi:hypothetical protein
LQNYDQLIFTAVHADKHFMNGRFQIKGYGDILNITENLSETFNAEEFMMRCKLHQSENVVLKHIRLIQQYTNQHSKIMHLHEYDTPIDKKFLSRFIEYYRGKTSLPNPAKIINSELKSIHNFKDKLKFFWKVVHPDKAFMIHRYKIKNPAYYRVYYLVRYWEGLTALLKK